MQGVGLTPGAMKVYERTIGVLQLRALISQIDVMFCCRPCSVALKSNRTLASVFV